MTKWTAKEQGSCRSGWSFESSYSSVLDKGQQERDVVLDRNADGPHPVKNAPLEWDLTVVRAISTMLSGRLRRVSLTLFAA